MSIEMFLVACVFLARILRNSIFMNIYNNYLLNITLFVIKIIIRNIIKYICIYHSIVYMYMKVSRKLMINENHQRCATSRCLYHEQQKETIIHVSTVVYRLASSVYTCEAMKRNTRHDCSECPICASSIGDRTRKSTFFCSSIDDYTILYNSNFL